MHKLNLWASEIHAMKETYNEELKEVRKKCPHVRFERIDDKAFVAGQCLDCGWIQRKIFTKT